MAAAVVRDGREIASSCVHGQDDVHRPYGGVVPELASRDHVRAVHQVVERALAEAGIAAEALDGIAVTAGPGLVGSLLVGLSFGKALAYRLGDPARRRAPPVGASRLGRARRRGAAAALSRARRLGRAHRALPDRRATAPPALLGETRDDAVGEAFDKVAALLGLGFPGRTRGRARGRAGDPTAFAFPRPLAGQPGLRLLLQRPQDRGGARWSSARGALGDARARRRRRVVRVRGDRRARRARAPAARATGLDRIAVVGGVAANRRLRRELAAAGERDGFARGVPAARRSAPTTPR